MKARWLVLASIICFALGYIIPYMLISEGLEQQEGWDAIWWIIVAPGIYGIITWVCWAVAVVLLISAIIVYVRRRK